MKKLLTVSLVAMMAVSAARAEIASTAYVDKYVGEASTAATGALNAYKTEMEGTVAGLNTAISDEETRAKGVEAGLTQAIADEETRAKAAEKANADAIAAINNSETGIGAATLAEAKDYTDEQVGALADGQVATNTDAISAMDAAYKAADAALDEAKQDKSGALSLGDAAGAWKTLATIDGYSTACGQGKVCALSEDGGNLKWVAVVDEKASL